jgi:hypothetical protein
MRRRRQREHGARSFAGRGPWGLAAAVAGAPLVSSGAFKSSSSARGHSGAPENRAFSWSGLLFLRSKPRVVAAERSRHLEKWAGVLAARAGCAVEVRETVASSSASSDHNETGKTARHPHWPQHRSRLSRAEELGQQASRCDQVLDLVNRDL